MRAVLFLLRTLTLLSLLTLLTPSHAASLPQRILDALKPNTTEPQFLHDAGKKPDGSSKNDTLIIFVHGIFGDTLTTWQREGTASVSEFLLKTDGFEIGYDTFAFGFPSTFLKSGSFSIPEAAKSFNQAWEYYDLAERYKTIVIVAHSMGGLVAINTLNLYPHLRSKVPLIISYSTPYQGAQVSTIASLLLKNPGLPGMKPGESNQLLASLTDHWKENNKGSTRIACTYEKVAIPGIGLIVESASSTALCDSASAAIAEDHISIVKPTNQRHPTMMFLVNELRRLKPPTSKTNDGKISSEQAKKLAVSVNQGEGAKREAKLLTEKLARSTAQLFNTNGLNVKLSNVLEKDRFVLELRTTYLSETEISIAATLNNPAQEQVATAEFSGTTSELRSLEAALPEAIVYALDINSRTLRKRNSAKRPTIDPLAYAAYVQAGAKLSAKETKEARGLLSAALNKDPNFAMAHWALGEISRLQRDEATAKAHYAAALKIDPDHPRVPLTSAAARENVLPDLLNALRLSKAVPAFDGARYRRAVSEAYRLTVHIWTFPKTDWSLDVIEQGSPFGATAEMLLPNDSSYVLAINGGYFHESKKRLTPDGILVRNNVVINRAPNKNLTAALAQTKSTIDVLQIGAVKEPLESYTLLLQAGPMLVDDPNQNGIPSTNESMERANRSAICVTGTDVSVIALFGDEGFGVTLRDMGSLLTERRDNGGLECSRAINLDGGWSTQVAIKMNGRNQRLGSTRPVQNVVAVRRKLKAA